MHLKCYFSFLQESLRFCRKTGGFEERKKKPKMIRRLLDIFIVCCFLFTPTFAAPDCSTNSNAAHCRDSTEAPVTTQSPGPTPAPPSSTAVPGAGGGGASPEATTSEETTTETTMTTTETTVATTETTMATTTSAPTRVYSSAPEIISFLEHTFTDATATYNSLIFPRNTFSETILVDIGFKLTAITDFDELAGTLEVIGILTISWYDQLADDDYDSDKHGHFTETTIPNQFVWKPPVSLFNSALAIVPVGDKANYVRLFRTTKQSDPYYGYARMVWTPGVVTKTGCVVDVAYFPFDKQSCNITFTNWGFTKDQVKFEPSADTIDLQDFSPSDEWTVTKTRLIEETLDNGSFVKFEISLERKPLYYLINFFLPIVIMGILNALVFILPLESGERVGYSVTSFLTFAVYLTLIADGMPRTSEPMAIMSYYLVSMVVMSCVATIITIFTLRVYLKDEDDPIPTPVTLLVACLNCLVCTRDDEDDDEDDEMPLLGSNGIEMDTMRKGSARKRPSPIEDNTSWTSYVPDNKYEVDWKLVASTLDGFSFVGILGGSIAIAVVFLVPLLAQW